MVLLLAKLVVISSLSSCPNVSGPNALALNSIKVKYSWLFSNVNYICNLGLHNLAISCIEAVPLCFGTHCIHHIQGEGERSRSHHGSKFGSVKLSSLRTI
jgi:hypothetical protein